MNPNERLDMNDVPEAHHMMTRAQVEALLQVVPSHEDYLRMTGILLAHDAALRQRIRELEKIVGMPVSEECEQLRQQLEDARTSISNLQNTCDERIMTIRQLRTELAAVREERDKERQVRLSYQEKSKLYDVCLVEVEHLQRQLAEAQGRVRELEGEP